MGRLAVSTTTLDIAENYRHMGRSIQRDAFLARVAGRKVDPSVDRAARVARMAAIAEEVNQDWRNRPVRACRICGSTDGCVS